MSKIVRNLTTNLLNFIVNILIGLWLPPFVINKIGIEAYGLIPLANTISSYALIITISINGSIARYLILDVTDKNYIKANRTFNSALWGLTGLLLVLIPILLYIAFHIQTFINVPNELISDAKYLFLLVFLSFVTTTFTSLFNSSSYINNRLDLITITTLIKSLVRLIGIVVLFYTFSVSLKAVGLATIVGAICSLILGIIFFKNQTPFLILNLKDFDKQIFKEILSMGGWLFVSQVGALMLLQIDLVVINLIKGAEAAGRYSVLLPWNALIRSFGAVLASVIAPIILQYYAQKKTEQILRISSMSVKYLGMLISIIVAVMCIHSKEILTLWLGPEFSSLSWLFVIILSHLGINLSVLPLFSITNALKKVTVPGIVTILIGLTNIGLAVVLLKFTSLGLYGVALSSFIVLTMKNIFFAAPYTAWVLGIKWNYFLKAMLPSLATFGFIFLTGKIVLTRFHISSWLSLVISISISLLISVLISGIVFSNAEERIKLKKLVKTKLKLSK